MQSFRLGDEQTLQQFSRDADEMENWIMEKMQLATEESYKVSLKLVDVAVLFKSNQINSFPYCICVY